MSRYREHDRTGKFSALQSRLLRTSYDAIHFTKGDVTLVKYLQTDLMSNQAFNPGLTRFDADHQNEQAFTFVFQLHLREKFVIVSKHPMALRSRLLTHNQLNYTVDYESI